MNESMRKTNIQQFSENIRPIHSLNLHWGKKEFVESSKNISISNYLKNLVLRKPNSIIFVLFSSPNHLRKAIRLIRLVLESKCMLNV